MKVQGASHNLEFLEFLNERKTAEFFEFEKYEYKNTRTSNSKI